MIRTLLLLLIPLALLAENESYVLKPGVATPPAALLTRSHWDYMDPAYTFDYGSGAERYKSNSFGPYTMYVDRTHPSATDTANPRGSPTTPRRTWTYPLGPGEVVQIHGVGIDNRYSQFSNAASGTHRMGGSGTEALPIFYIGCGAAPQRTAGRESSQTIRDADDAADAANMVWYGTGSSQSHCYQQGDWTIVKNLAFTNCIMTTREDLKGSGITGIAVRGIRNRGTGATTAGATACAWSGSASVSSQFVYQGLVFDSVISDCGNYLSTTENDSCGVIAGGYVTNFWCLKTEIYHCGGDSIRTGSDQGATKNNKFIYVADCDFYENGENAVDIKQTSYAVYSGNRMHDFVNRKTDGSSNAEILVIHYTPDHLYLLGNLMYNGRRGVVSSGIVASDICWLVGNALWNVTDEALYLDRGGGFFNVWNNTIYGCGYGIISSGSVNGFSLRNNIVSGSTGNDLQISDSTARAASTAQNENYYGTPNISWGSTYTTVASWDSAQSSVSGCLSVDPLFVGTGDNDYRLQASSPMIGAATDISSTLTGTFLTDFGFALSWLDIEGTARPADSLDIGAYEYGTTVDASPKGYKQQQIIGVGVGL